MTAREAAIIRQLSIGASNKLIARRLFVSENTVKYHLKNIYYKLGARSRLEALYVMRDSDLLRGGN